MTNRKRAALLQRQIDFTLAGCVTGTVPVLAAEMQRTTSSSSTASPATGRQALFVGLDASHKKTKLLSSVEIHRPNSREPLYTDFFGMRFHPRVIAKLNLTSLKSIAVKTHEFCNRLKALINPDRPFGHTDEEVRHHLGLCPGIIVPPSIDETTYELLVADIKREVEKQGCPTLYRVTYNKQTYICNTAQKQAIQDDYAEQKRVVERRLRMGVTVLAMTGGGVFFSGLGVVAATPLPALGIFSALQSNVTHFLLLTMMLRDLGQRVAPRVEHLFSISRPETKHMPFSGKMSLAGNSTKVSYQVTEVDLRESTTEEQEDIATLIQDGHNPRGEASSPLYIFRPERETRVTGPLFESYRLLTVSARQLHPVEAYMGLEDYLETEYPTKTWTQEAITTVFMMTYNSTEFTLDFEKVDNILTTLTPLQNPVTFQLIKDNIADAPKRLEVRQLALDTYPQLQAKFEPMISAELQILQAEIAIKHHPRPEELAPDLIGTDQEKEEVKRFITPEDEPTPPKFTKVLEIAGPFGTGKTHLIFDLMAHANENIRNPKDQKKPFTIRENGQEYMSFLSPDEYAQKLAAISKSNPILSSKLILGGIAVFGITMTALYIAQLNEAAKNCRTDEERSLNAATTALVNSIVDLVGSSPTLTAEQIASSFSKSLELLRAPTQQDIAPGSEAFPILLPGIPCANVGTIRQTIQTLSMGTFGALATFWGCVKVSSLLPFQRDNHISLVPPLETTFSLSEDLPGDDDALELLLQRIYASNHGCLYIQNGQHLSKARLKQLIHLHEQHRRHGDTETELLVLMTTNPGQGDLKREKALGEYLKKEIQGKEATDYACVILPQHIEDKGAHTTRELAYLLDTFCKRNAKPLLNYKSKALVIHFIRQVAKHEGHAGQLDVGRRLQQLLHTVQWSLDQSEFQLGRDDLAVGYDSVRFESIV